MTRAEVILWGALKDRFEVRFRRQHPIEFFIVDFYCHSLKLVIEVDGEVHSLWHQRGRDEIRTDRLRELGLHELRFTNDEIFNSMEHVIDQITSYQKQIAAGREYPLQGIIGGISGGRQEDD